MDESIEYTPIGRIRTPFDDPAGMPIQAAATATGGTVELEERFAPGVADLEEFSHAILVYHFHRGDPEPSLSVTPFLDEADRGVFATRAPVRPNRIGLSVVRVVAVEGATITVEGADVVDGTPLLDVKPFVPTFDAPEDADVGWLEGVDDPGAVTADERFTDADEVNRE